MTDYTELKQLADSAKNWGGEVGEDRWYTAECFKQPYFSVPDAEFIAACDPGRIRALIAENERLHLDNSSLRGSCARLGAEHAAMSRNFKKANRMQCEARTERDQLKAENEALASSRAKLAGELSRLRAKHKDWSVDAAMGKGELS